MCFIKQISQSFGERCSYHLVEGWLPSMHGMLRFGGRCSYRFTEGWLPPLQDMLRFGGRLTFVMVVSLVALLCDFSMFI